MDLRAIDDALKLQADEPALERGPLRYDFIDDTHQVVERRCCAVALRLHHCGFGSRCQLRLQDTHWLHFSVLTLLHEYEAISTLSPMPGQAALRGERVAVPPGRH